MRGLILLPGLLFIFSLAQAVGVTEISIAELSNLQTEARKVSQNQRPLLIMFSTEHCPYCETVKEAFIKPMLRGGHYTHKVLIRKVELDSHKMLKDFNGAYISVQQLASRYKVFVTPTLIFIDEKGLALTKPLVGIATVDYYGGYLDNAIDESLIALKKRLSNSQKHAQVSSLSENDALPLHDDD
jgi:thioredoxin-related protein